jgi:hypothetical protein
MLLELLLYLAELLRISGAAVDAEPSDGRAAGDATAAF